MDETGALTEYGQKTKVFGASSTDHGGCISQSTGSGEGRHVTAVIAVSASGHKAPPFFIVQGKNVMRNWFLPLNSEVYTSFPLEMSSLLTESWFPSKGVVVCSENGSMTMDFMPLFVEHVNNFDRTIVPSEVSYCVTIDGHSSRKGVDWIEKCMQNKIEVAQTPANTSHFLQPCDQSVNKNYKVNIRKVRDKLTKGVIVDTKTIGFKLMCAAKAWEMITIDNVKTSFRKTKMWPVDHRFITFFAPKRSAIQNNESGTRRTDAATAEALKEILNGDKPAPLQLKEVAIELAKTCTTNSILMGQQRPRVVLRQAERNYVISAGLPAELLTVEEALARKKEQIEEVAKKKEAAAKRKADAAERARKIEKLSRKRKAASSLSSASRRAIRSKLHMPYRP